MTHNLRKKTPTEVSERLEAIFRQITPMLIKPTLSQAESGEMWQLIGEARGLCWVAGAEEAFDAMFGETLSAIRAQEQG